MKKVIVLIIAIVVLCSNCTDINPIKPKLHDNDNNTTITDINVSGGYSRGKHE